MLGCHILLLTGLGAGGQPSAFTVCWDLSLLLSSNGLSLLESHRIRRKEVSRGRQKHSRAADSCVPPRWGPCKP